MSFCRETLSLGQIRIRDYLCVGFTKVTSISKLRTMSWGGQAYREFLDHLGRVEELKHEEGAKEAISEIKTLTRRQRIDRNSPDLAKLPGGLAERKQNSSLYGKQVNRQ